MKTLTYKTTNQLDLQADIYGADTTTTTRKPVILWIHGGALIMGNRTGIAPDQLERYLDAGFVVVSIDYRLAPETKLPHIVEDIEDAIKWIRTTGANDLGIDPTRLGVVGHSAGGYLTLLTGHRANPAPKALVAFYGYGDLIGPWYSKPDPFYNTFDPISEEAAHAAIGETELVDGSADPRRRDFYHWCRQNGLWPTRIADHDPLKESDWFAQYCPENNVKNINNITERDSNYPPTLLLHGDADTDVPYAQSVTMAQRLLDAGVEHDLITIPNGPHGFDHNPKTTSTPETKTALETVITFLKTHL